MTLDRFFSRATGISRRCSALGLFHPEEKSLLARFGDCAVLDSRPQDAKLDSSRRWSSVGATHFK
jgi:hypothetical protein